MTAPERAAADSVAPLRLVLNVPACRLDVVERGSVRHSYPVAVGTEDHRTPLGSFPVDRVVWNPWWVPPPFEWARDMTVTPPGPDNPTGRVKLFFGYYHFLHGTPLEESLGAPASHGCVRMRNADAIALARVVHAHGSPDLAPVVLDSLEGDPRRTRTIRLAEPVPLSILYQRIEIRRGRLELHPDPYGLEPIRAEDVRAALRVAGLPPEALDLAVIEAAIARADRESVSIPLDLSPSMPPR